MFPSTLDINRFLKTSCAMRLALQNSMGKLRKIRDVIDRHASVYDVS